MSLAPLYTIHYFEHDNVLHHLFIVTNSIFLMLFGFGFRILWVGVANFKRVALKGLKTALYFSTFTDTPLGSGEIVLSEQRRFLASF